MLRKNLFSLSVFVGLSAALIIGMGLSCNKPPAVPGIPAGPATAYQRATAAFKVFTTASGDVQYVMDWGDGTTDTSDGTSAGETTYVYHRWESAGDYAVRAMAILESKPDLASEWSGAANITILPNNVPAVPTALIPPIAVRNAATVFAAQTTDPDGDSVAYQFDFGGDEGDWTALVPSGGVGYDTTTFSTIETVQVRCRARDSKLSESDWSEAQDLIVGTAGAVKWWWWTDDEEQEPALISPVIRTWDGEELAYTSAAFPNKMYGIRVTDGVVRESGSPVAVTEENTFSGHPAFCAQTNHIIVGGEDGELYAFTQSLSDDWHWPGHTEPDSLSYIEWGAPMINGNKIYVPRDDDFLYYFQDLNTAVSLVGSYLIQEISETGAIDAGGNVYVTTATGWLYKMLPDLTAPVWAKEISAGSDLYPPRISSDGSVYVGSANGRLYKIDPANGIPTWGVDLMSGDVRNYAIGYSAVYVTTGLGILLSVRPNDGGINWYKGLGYGEIVTHPILVNAPAEVGDALIYVQDIDDIVYCVKQSDGTVIWSCNCLDYGPEFRGGGSDRKFFPSEGSPGITATGDLIVIGEEALYCVAGYPDGTLQAAPWPKWQQNSDNTGKAAGW